MWPIKFYNVLSNLQKLIVECKHALFGVLLHRKRKHYVDITASHMEPPKKRRKQCAPWKGFANNFHIPCIVVSEMIPKLAAKHGCTLNVEDKKNKRSHVRAVTEWFYKDVPIMSTFVNDRKPNFLKPENCKKILVKAHQIKAAKQRKTTSFFEVEYVADFKVLNGRRYYLIKWTGWPKEANTWEYVSNLSCSKLIIEFHCDYINQLNEFLGERKLSWPQLLKTGEKQQNRLLQRLYNMTPNNFHFEANYAKAKKILQMKLLRWQTKINAITRGCPLIVIENEVNLEGLPSDFEYIEQNKPGVGVEIPSDPLIGCHCVGSCALPMEMGNCCPGLHRQKCAYKNGLLNIKPGKPIFECNSRCNCGLNCPNRIVQRGPQLAMSLFRTINGKGWGVKALEPIQKGAFVMEYVGEVITNDEAERRGKVYDSCGITYLFDLDFNDSENPLTVDATNFGNISHFVNHSCSPNLQVYNVFIDNIDPSFPRIALFARRNIAVNEEFTFDYQMTGDMTDGEARPPDLDDILPGLDEKNTLPVVNGDSALAQRRNGDDTASDISRASSCSSVLKRTKCLCASRNCRGWLI